MALYDIAILGQPSDEQKRALIDGIVDALSHFKLRVNRDFTFIDQPGHYRAPQRACAVGVYFGYPGGGQADLGITIKRSELSVLPVANSAKAVSQEIPDALRTLNCLTLDVHSMDRVVTATLECLGLLRQQRKVFISYRREESTSAALMLFAELSGRGFDVFLDTHGVRAAADFQETLWHRLCDVDVMIMLDTKSYFQSRWTSEEFGRALAKNIGVLRVQWPDSTPDKRTKTCSRVELVEDELRPHGGVSMDAIRRIADQLETFRAVSLAVRRLGIMTKLDKAVESISGTVIGVGPRFSTRVQLADGSEFTIQPVIGIPDATSAQEAIERADNSKAAVLYDHIGVRSSWIAHLSWLERHIQDAKWIRLSEAAWDLAGAP